MGSNYRWVPFLDGSRLNYHEYFALVGSSVAFVLSFVCFILNLILRRLATIQRDKQELGQETNSSSSYRLIRGNVYNNPSINPNERRLEMGQLPSSSNDISSSLPQQQVIFRNLLGDYNSNNSSNPTGELNSIDSNDIQSTLKCSNNCLLSAADFFYNATYFFLSVCPLILGALTIISTFISIILMSVIFYIQYIVDKNTPQLVMSNGSLKNVQTNFSKKQIIGIAAYCIFFPLFVHNTCVAFYNDEIGFYSPTIGFTFNTQFTRYFQLPEMCPPGPPCHLYATLPEDTAHDVFISTHTHISITNVTVFYDLEATYLENPSAPLRFSSNAVLFPIEQSEKKGQRNVHSALLSNLTPKTRYVIQIKYEGDNTVQATHVYKTLPEKSDPTLNLTMINAGDAGNTEPARNFNKLLTTLKPDIFFMGGDIAYDDGFETCYYTWDFYLSDLEKTFKTLGYLLPMVWTVGNHDVGLNELPLVNITQTNTKGPAYLSYFPQHYERDADFNIVKQVPQLINRRTVFHHEVANFVYLSLDSGYLHDFSGWQESYINSTLASNPDSFKFANYHVPVYSACGDISLKDNTPIVRALFHWIPLFDQYRMASVYENHVHTFKRTYPMVGNRVVPKDGTVYLGDGAYGAIPNYCKLNTELKIFAKAAVVNNFWVTQVTQDKLSHRAFNRDGNVMDTYEQTADYYREI